MRAKCCESFTSLLESQGSVFNRLRHFYKGSEVFCIVYVTFVKLARCFELFTSLLERQRSAFSRLRPFYKVSELF